MDRDPKPTVIQASDISGVTHFWHQPPYLPASSPFSGQPTPNRLQKSAPPPNHRGTVGLPLWLTFSVSSAEGLKAEKGSFAS
ncbi:unnamed protein product [Victoria cruziana]